ncbi:50S ribosomal protein L3 [Allofournierella sp.]|uniref:50S ribosomal protein L3 n=1 Tax=Allofournierella sp. TaxID=1940256 RepID=UPI0015A9FD72|nr:50S ribosomal protein L3 [Oscillospiraceae bacterium]
MQKGIIGKKLGMTQLFDENGKVVPVTVIEAGPCTVVQKKTLESDGYQAVQLGYGDIAAKKVTKPLKGHFDKADVAPKRTLREFRLADISALNVGDILKADVFATGEHIDVVGVSKGKGYAGTIKRWNGHRLRESHGTGPVSRHAGSMGSCSTPSRVFKGKKLPGHLGAERVTIQNLTVVKVDPENNLIAIKGAVPGPKGAVVCISDSVKA